MDRAADSILWLDPTAQLIYANDAACHILGYSAQTLLTMTIFEIDQNLNQQNWPAHWRKLQQEGILTDESHYQGQDGHLFPVEITANYLEFNG